MTDSATAGVASLLEPVLAAMPAPSRPRFIADLERRAALRYREWAKTADAEPALRDGLLACAAREQQIANLICGAYPEQSGEAELFASLEAAVTEGSRTLFEGKPLAGQFAAQAAGERIGAATWRGLANQEADRGRIDTLERCAQLEEANAEFLEGLA